MASSDAPLLERLAQLPAVPIAELVELLGRMPNLAKDPILAGLVGVDDEGEPAVHPLLAAVIEHLGQRPEGTCYSALIEALTGIWNAAVRGAAVARLRAAGLHRRPAPALAAALSDAWSSGGNREWARQWMADPQDRMLSWFNNASCDCCWPYGARGVPGLSRNRKGHRDLAPERGQEPRRPGPLRDVRAHWTWGRIVSSTPTGLARRRSAGCWRVSKI
jgi:hypothetical protein